MTDTLIKGSLTFNPKTDVIAIGQIMPPISSGKVWRLNSAIVAMNVNAVGTTQGHFMFVVQNKVPTGGRVFDAQLVLPETQGIVSLDSGEGTSGLVTGYKAGLVYVDRIPDEIFLNEDFYVAFSTNGTDAGGTDLVSLSYALYLEEVKVTTSIQSKILSSMS